MAEALKMPILARMWQMLLKALEEVSAAPNAMMAAEMAIIRLTHVADLPTPGDLVRKLQDATPPPAGPGGGGRPMAPAQRSGPAGYAAPPPSAPRGTPPGAGPMAALQVSPEEALARYASFDHVIELIRANREVTLLIEVERTLKLARYSPGRIEFQPTDDAAPDLAQRLGQRLQAWTGNRWAVSVVSAGGGPTITEARDSKQRELEQAALAHPMVQAALAAFPKARIADIRTPDQIAAAAAMDALPEVEDEWDPFEED